MASCKVQSHSDCVLRLIDVVAHPVLNSIPSLGSERGHVCSLGFLTVLLPDRDASSKLAPFFVSVSYVFPSEVKCRT